MRIVVIAMMLLLTSCTSSNVSERIAAVDSRPLLSDSVKVPQIEKVELASLEKIAPDSNGICISKTSLLKVDNQRRNDRATVNDLNNALMYSVQAQDSLLRALRATELELKATERMLIRTEEEYRQIKREKQFDDITNKLIQLGLLILVVIP